MVPERLGRRFRLKVAEIGGEEPLAKQELAACQIFVPGSRPVPPGLRALVMNAPRPHGHAGPHIGPGLEGVAVEHETVDSLAEGPVAQRLDGCRVLRPALGIVGGERLGADDRLAERVAGRGHAPAGLDRAAADPELAHRLIRLAGVGQMVARAAVGLGRESQAMLVRELAHASGVVLDDQLGDRLPQIPEEALGDFRACHDAAGHDRQVRRDLIAPTPLELFAHPCRPVLRTILPAIDVGRDERLAGWPGRRLA